MGGVPIRWRRFLTNGVPLPGWNRPTPPSIDGGKSRNDSQSAHLVTRTFSDKRPSADAIIKLLNILRYQGDAVGVAAYNAGLKSLLSRLPSTEKSDRAAEQIHRDMRGIGILPNAVTWELLIYFHGKAGNFDKSLALKKQMSDSGFQITESVRLNLLRVAPHPSARRELISQSGSKLSTGQIEAAIQSSSSPSEAYLYIDLLCDFSKKKHHPGLKSLSRLLHLSASTGNEPASTEIFNLIKEEGYTVDVVVWTSLMSVYKDIGHVSKAAKCFLDMIRSDIDPTRHTYSVLLLTLCNCKTLNRNEKVNIAEAIVSKTWSVLPPSIHIVTVMMRIYASVGDSTAANLLLNRIRSEFKITTPLRNYHAAACKSRGKGGGVRRRKMTFENAIKECVQHGS